MTYSVSFRLNPHETVFKIHSAHFLWFCLYIKYMLNIVLIHFLFKGLHVYPGSSGEALRLKEMLDKFH